MKGKEGVSSLANMFNVRFSKLSEDKEFFCRLALHQPVIRSESNYIEDDNSNKLPLRVALNPDIFHTM